jgi:ribosomal protein L10
LENLMARKKGKVTVIRAAILRRAANRYGCEVKDIFNRAMPGISNQSINLNNIPHEVFKLARGMVEGKQRGRPRPRMIPRHRRSARHFTGAY